MQALKTMSPSKPLTEDNYGHTVLVFRDRQAGVSEIFNPTEGESGLFTYNAYCLEKKLLKELFTCEYEFLSDALEAINEEFGSWKPESFEEEKGCGNCAAKK